MYAQTNVGLLCFFDSGSNVPSALDRAATGTDQDGTTQSNEDVRSSQKVVQDDKKTGNLKIPTKIEEIQKKKLLTEIEPLQFAF